MVFYCRFVISTSGFGFVGEVAEVVGFFIEGYRSGPFFISLIPVDTFVFGGLAFIAAVFNRAAFNVAAVLGESAQPQVPLSVIYAIVVDVIDDQMVGGVHNLAVHFDALAVFLSHSVNIIARPLGEPGIFAEARIIFGIDNGEFTAGKRYQPRRIVFGVGGP